MSNLIFYLIVFLAVDDQWLSIGLEIYDISSLKSRLSLCIIFLSVLFLT